MNPGPLELNSPWIAQRERPNTSTKKTITTHPAGNVRHNDLYLQLFDLSLRGNVLGVGAWRSSYPDLDLNVTNRGGLTALHIAIKNKHRELVNWLIVQPGLFVDARALDGSTAFHWCALNDDLGTARLLLDHGAGIDAQDFNGWTPL